MNNTTKATCISIVLALTYIFLRKSKEVKYNTIFAIVSSLIIGTLYYLMMERSVSRNSNCSFISTIWTDIIAIIFSIVLIYKGYIYNDTLVTIIGGCILTEHIWQLLPKYSIDLFD